MEQKINIAELLKDCPRGMELDCAIYENVTLVEVKEGYDYPIVIETPNGQMLLSKYGCFSKNELAKCVIFPKGKTTWEGFHRPFKDGDILVHTQNQRLITSIYHNRVTELIIGTHCILWDKNDGLTVNAQICCYPDDTRFATEEEKEKLFQAIKENGYRWNAETKTLEKLSKFKVGDRVRNKNYKDYIYDIHDITDKGYRAKEINADSPIIILFGSQEDNYELVPNKFDVINFEPFMKVLVRDNNEQFWTCDWFSFHDTKQVYPFACVGHYVSQCIPYEKNEHLLGTTDDCDEYYKNW